MPRRTPPQVAPYGPGPLAAAFLVAGVAVVAIALGLAQPSDAGAVLDSGSVRMGVTDLGNLGTPGNPNAAGTTSMVGLRLAATNQDGIASGECGCEGWGVAHDASASYVKGASVTGIQPVSFASSSSTAQSVVNAGSLRVTHSTHPTSLTPYAFQTDITVQNQGAALASNVLYRRVVDWAVDPAPGHEYVTLHATVPAPSWLLWSSDDGGAGASPLLGASQLFASGPPAGSDFDDVGPLDHGALFDLNLGCLGPSDSAAFQMYYGAAPTEAAALAALAAVGAQAWSLAQPQGDAATGTPQTFFLGFGGIHGPNCITPAMTATFTSTSPQDLTLDPVQFTALTPPAQYLGYEHRRIWSFGDGGQVEASSASHAYAIAGTYNACLLELARPPAGQWRTWTRCQTVWAHNRPPNVDFEANHTADGLAVAFTDLSHDPDGSIAAHSWTFGDGASSSSPSPTHTYPAGGIYHACLTVVDDLGSPATTCHDIGSPGALNHVPILLPIPSRQVAVGGLVEFHLVAYDSDLDPLTFNASNLPAGATFSPTDVLFRWIPTKAQLGYHNDITFRVSDGKGGVSERILVALVSLTVADRDNDGIPDDGDNCPAKSNSGQGDNDGDGHGDACDGSTEAAPDDHDIYVGSTTTSTTSYDECNDELAMDRDGDRVPDACDDDLDGDGVPNRAAEGTFLDNCPLLHNPDQSDSDNDGFGDKCKAPVLYGAKQEAAPAKIKARPLPQLDQDQYPLDPQASQSGIQPWMTVVMIAAAGIFLGVVVGVIVRARLRN